jgi:hypothetical protein
MRRKQLQARLTRTEDWLRSQHRRIDHLEATVRNMEEMLSRRTAELDAARRTLDRIGMLATCDRTSARVFRAGGGGGGGGSARYKGL